MWQRPEPLPVGIVTVNHNTRELVASLLFSLFRILGPAEFADVVVVDNGSTDGSLALLRAAQAAGLIHLIENDANHYHGPGLTQGVSWLARQRSDAVGPVWLLDSDCVVLRHDTVRHATARRAAGRAASAQTDEGSGRVALNSLMLDPGTVWRDQVPPFVETGAPTAELEAHVRSEGWPIVEFPFRADGYVLHLGRGTLATVVAGGDRGNHYFEWAEGHHTPHFGLARRGKRTWRRFSRLFRKAAPGLTTSAVVDACCHGELLTLRA